ncbi:MAG: hypothetical protein NT178_16700 [Proteobacteria bacterium]|nr:hypothetical protein [Pseudomonadota bacterium]
MSTTKNDKLYEKVCKDEPLFWGILKITIGIWMYYLSSKYMSSSGNYRLNIFLLPDTLVFLMFGAVVSLVYYSYYGIMYSKYEHDLSITARLLFIFGDIFVYTSFFSIVLFPLSGFGVVQWAFVAYMLFTNLIMAKNEGFFRCFDPLSFLIIGVVMYIAKIFVQYSLPQNPYQEFISGNTTMRWAIFAIAFVFGIKYMIDLFKRKEDLNMAGSSSIARKILNFGIETTKKFVKIVMSAGILIPLIGILLSVGLPVVIYIVVKMQTDLWNNLGSLLDKLLTTDRLSIISSRSLAVFQLIAFFVFLAYFAINSIIFKQFTDNEKKAFNEFLNNYPDEFLEIINKDAFMDMALKEKGGITIASKAKDLRDAIKIEYKKFQKNQVPQVTGKT